MADFSLDGVRTTLRGAFGPGEYSPQIERSLALAFRGHHGQFRDQPEGAKGPRLPYIVHPVGVAMLALKYLSSAALEDSRDDIVSACLTHDLLEDTSVTPLELERDASQRTAQIVTSLTKPLVQQDLPRHERDEALMKQIVKGGRSAGFVKICDYLHNIGRPEQTPAHILEKSIRKGRSLYARLFEEFELPVELKAEYLRRLEAAETRARALSGAGNSEGVVLSLADAMKHCVEHADRKVLERHDILDLLSTAFGSDIVRAMSIDEFIEHVLVENATALPQKTRVRVARALRAGELTMKGLEDAGLQEACLGLSRVVAAPRAEAGFAAAGEDDFIFVGVPQRAEPHWASPQTLRMLYVYVSERLRLQEKKRQTDIESTVARLGLAVSAQDVQDLGLTHNDLYDLSALTEYAELVRGQIQRAVEFELSSGRFKSSIAKVEARAKTAQSIIAKMIRRNQRIEELDDIVGLRVVCLAQRDVGQIAQAVNACIAKLAARSSESAGEQAPKIVQSTAGYRASHAYVQFPGQHPKDKWIGCELQIRTIHQDAWAKLSEQLSYKKSRVSAQSMSAGLQQLAELRDQADAIVDRITSSER